VKRHESNGVAAVVLPFFLAAALAAAASIANAKSEDGSTVVAMLVGQFAGVLWGLAMALVRLGVLPNTRLTIVASAVLLPPVLIILVASTGIFPMRAFVPATFVGWLLSIAVERLAVAGKN
jgi:Fe2+ transport system protein FeoA